jgi:hypothetical protein
MSLFVFTPDVGDHFVSSATTNLGWRRCERGPHSHVGESTWNALAASRSSTPTFSEHSDDTPKIFLRAKSAALT